MKNKIYGITATETRKIPIYAGMPLGKTSDNKIKKVGFKIVQFTYDVNPANPEDRMQISEKELSRTITPKPCRQPATK
jgi:hypothetical protein